MHTVTERLALLAFDNARRKLGETADMRLGYGLCAALLCDLLVERLVQVQGGEIVPGAATPQPTHPLLQMGVELLPQRPMPAAEALRHFHAAGDKIRKQVLDCLTEQGVLRAKTNRLKWAFAVAVHTLRPASAGYRAAVMDDLSKNRIRPMDARALQLALAVRLLDGGASKKWQSALIKANVGTDWLLELVEKNLPDIRQKKGKAAKVNSPVTWEWRSFWLDKEETRKKENALYVAISGGSRVTREDDRYLIVDGMAENIKWRNEMLEIKRSVAAEGEYTAFAPKERYRFPLSVEKASRIFDRLSPPSKPLKDMTALKRYLTLHGLDYTQIEVRKKRSRAKLHPLVRVEFCTLSVGGRNYVSVCVESPEKELTANYAKHFRTANAMAKSYVEFLKQQQMEQAE